MSIPLYDPRASFEQLKFHTGHRISVVQYCHPSSTEVANVSIECETCGEVILNFDDPDMED